MTEAICDFLLDGSEYSVQDVISKLKFIGKIQEGEIVDVKTLSLHKRGWATSFSRTFLTSGESRAATLDFFRQIISNGFDMAQRYFRMEGEMNKKLGDIIVRALNECKKGLINTSKTYHEDQHYSSQIETLIETLNIRADDLNETITIQKV